MGVVYRALDVDLGRQVAIKTLPLRVRKTPFACGGAKAMASVQHENLALIFGAETWRGTPMLVVELLTEGTLSAKLRQAPIPPVRAVDIAVALARGVEHLPRRPSSTGSIKPSNIGFTRSDVPKLLDFGVARILRERLTSTETTTRTATGRVAPGASTMQWPTDTHVAGTPLYMSPEALDGERARPAFDVWSLTVVLFEMIAGVPPFRGTSITAIREAMRGRGGTGCPRLLSRVPGPDRGLPAGRALQPSRRPSPHAVAAARLAFALARSRASGIGSRPHPQ